MIYELDPTLTGPDQLRADPVLAEAAGKAYHAAQSGIYAMLPCALSYASLPQVVSEPSLKRIIDRLPGAATRRDEVLQKQFEQPRRGQVEFLFDLGNWYVYLSALPWRRHIHGDLDGLNPCCLALGHHSSTRRYHPFYLAIILSSLSIPFQIELLEDATQNQLPVPRLTAPPGLRPTPAKKTKSTAQC